jgi:hypothetical protein
MRNLNFTLFYHKRLKNPLGTALVIMDPNPSATNKNKNGAKGWMKKTLKWEEVVFKSIVYFLFNIPLHFFSLIS